MPSPTKEQREQAIHCPEEDSFLIQVCDWLAAIHKGRF